MFHERHARPDLYVFRRGERPTARPIYDSYPGKAGEESVGVARKLDDLVKVMSIRSAVYVGEQSCPYDEEFDGNDLCATHLIGYVGHEPAASIRVRFFADFAKLERLSVRREFRKSSLAFALVRAGIELARVKGYRRIYGHAQKRLVPFWRRFGAKVMPTKEFAFSDFDYVEMLLEAEKHPAAIAVGSDPYVIIRPEGRWHVPGILERSASRPVTRPSVGEETAKQRPKLRERKTETQAKAAYA